MAALTPNDCAEIIARYLASNADQYILSGAQFAEAIDSSDDSQGSSNTNQASKVLEKGWSMLGKYANTESQGGKSVFGLLSKGAALLDESLSKKNDSNGGKPETLKWLWSNDPMDVSYVRDYLVRNAEKTHCVIDKQLFFFADRFLFIRDMDAESQPFDPNANRYKKSNVSFPVTDLGEAEYWIENFGAGIEDAGHFCLTDKRTGEEFEALFQPADTVFRHVENLSRLMRQRLHEKNQAELGDRRDEIFEGLPLDSNRGLLLMDCSDLDKVLKANQEAIISIDRSYIQKFVKASQYLKTKKKNIETIFDALVKSKNIVELDRLFEMLMGEINTYNLVLLHSLNMVSTLVDDDMISFYETYELFDSLNMFDSQWERDTAQRLDGISDQIQSMNENLGSLLQDILIQSQRMEERIVKGINNLSQITASGFSSMEAKLGAVHSTLKLNTLIGAVQLYQTNRRLT